MILKPIAVSVRICATTNTFHIQNTNGERVNERFLLPFSTLLLTVLLFFSPLSLSFSFSLNTLFVLSFCKLVLQFRIAAAVGERIRGNWLGIRTEEKRATTTSNFNQHLLQKNAYLKSEILKDCRCFYSGYSNKGK